MTNIIKNYYYDPNVYSTELNHKAQTTSTTKRIFHSIITVFTQFVENSKTSLPTYFLIGSVISFAIGRKIPSLKLIVGLTAFVSGFELLLTTAYVAVRTFFKDSFSVSSKRSHYIISKNKVEEALESVINRKLPFVNRWIEEVHENESIDILKKKIWQTTRGGTCFGQTMSLIDLMSSYYHLPSKQLIEKMDEKLIYEKQIQQCISVETSLAMMYYSLLEIKKLVAPSTNALRELFSLPHAKILGVNLDYTPRKINVDVEEMKSSFLNQLNSRPYYAPNKVELQRIVFAEKNRVLNAIEEFSRNERLNSVTPPESSPFPANTIFSGNITLFSHTGDGHSLFFQYSPHFYRFYDMNDGFYEMTDSHMFFCVLNKYLKDNYYLNKNISFETMRYYYSCCRT